MNRRLFSGLVWFNTAFVVGREVSFTYPDDIMIAAEVQQKTDLVDDDEKVIEKMPARRTAIYCNEDNFRLMTEGIGVFALSGKKGLEYKTTVENISTMTVMVTTKGFLSGKRTYSQIVRPEFDKYLTDVEISAAIREVRNWQRCNVSLIWKSLV